MAVLDDDVKGFIVRSLACYNTPSEVAELVKEEYGIEIERCQAAKYDPTKPHGKNLGRKHRDLFEQTRKKFLEEMAELPLANPSVRVSELSKLYKSAKAKKNAVLAAQHLEQIAKEVGGAFTNKIKLAGGDPGDSPIQQNVTVTASRMAELRAKSAKTKALTKQK